MLFINNSCFIYHEYFKSKLNGGKILFGRLRSRTGQDWGKMSALSSRPAFLDK